MPRSRKPVSAQLRDALEQERAARTRVRSLLKRQAEFDREVLADCGQAMLHRAAVSSQLTESFRLHILPAIASPERRQRLEEMLGELTGPGSAG